MSSNRNGNNSDDSGASKWASEIGIDDSISQLGEQAINEINEILDQEQQNREREGLRWRAGFHPNRNER